MDSNVGLAIQCVGVVLIAGLSLFMRGSIRSLSLKYWATAWTSLALALASLFVGFHLERGQNLCYSAYFFGEYAFGLLFVAGCREHSTGARIGRPYLFLLLAALTIALALPHLSADFNDLFIVQATVMAALFAGSFLSLRDARRHESTPGLRVMSVAVLLLAIDFLHYVPIFGTRKGSWGLGIPNAYLKYTSIIDLTLEVLLGFGSMMVLLEGVRREVEAANHKLTQARDKLELLAQMDPLTEALNRHAFHSLLSRDESDSETEVSGCVAVIDLDNLKQINDSLGHNVGDKAIRAVARATRSLIRADDMLFRWGGDEFMVLMFKLHESEASRRMESLNEILELNGPQWTSAPVKIAASFGVCGFKSLRQLGQAIEDADKAMYQSRQQLRRPKLSKLDYPDPELALSH